MLKEMENSLQTCWYPYIQPTYQPTFVTYPVTFCPTGLLNEAARIERDKIRDLIGEDAIKALVEAGYEVIRK